MRSNQFFISAVKLIFVFASCYWLLILAYRPMQYLSAVQITAKLDHLSQSKKSTPSTKGLGSTNYTAHVGFNYLINGTSFRSDCFSAGGNISNDGNYFDENYDALWKHLGDDIQVWYLASDNSACIYRNWPWKKIWLALLAFGLSLFLAFHPQSFLNSLFNYVNRNTKE